MVEDQLVKREIADVRVLEAMGTIPRHRFVPDNLHAQAYDDNALVIGHKQTISQPYIVAYMLELLALRESDTVLEIGTGSGYQTALLARLCNAVVTIERIDALSQAAGSVLRELDITNVTLRVGDGTLGASDLAPFNAIVVSAGGPGIPMILRGQLAEGGRLVCPVGDRNSQCLVVVHRSGDQFEVKECAQCRFVPLIGEEGWAT